MLHGQRDLCPALLLQGGDVRFQVNALRGDVDQNGRVNSDLYALRARLLRHASEPASWAGRLTRLCDLDADGRVDARDVTALRAALFSQLPAAPPVAPAAGPLAARRVPLVRELWRTDGVVA